MVQNVMILVNVLWNSLINQCSTYNNSNEKNIKNSISLKCIKVCLEFLMQTHVSENSGNQAVFIKYVTVSLYSMTLDLKRTLHEIVLEWVHLICIIMKNENFSDRNSASPQKGVKKQFCLLTLNGMVLVLIVLESETLKPIFWINDISLIQERIIPSISHCRTMRALIVTVIS